VTALAKHKRIPVEELEGYGVCDLPTGGVGIYYYGPTGEEIAVKRRTAFKAKEGSYWPKATPLAAYGQWKLPKAAKAGILFLVEGESDCWTLWHYGLPALGLPGSNTVKTLQQEHVESVQTIYVHREPDTGGEQFIQGVCDRLQELHFPGKVFDLHMPEGVKDPSDLHAEDERNFLQRFDAAIQAATPVKLGFVHSVLSVPCLWQPPIPLDEAPQVAPFPIDVLPGRLADFVDEVGRALNAPPDYAAVPMLTIAGAAAGTSRAVEIKRGWTERGCLYAGVVGAPGGAKTPALKHVARPVYDEQSKLAKNYRIAKREWNKLEPTERGDPPTRETVYVCDVTTEKLAEILRDNPRGVALIRDELTGWVASMNQYRAHGRGADRQFFLSAWAGEPVHVDRKNKDEPVYVPHPFIGAIGGLPPDLLPKLRGEKDIADGWFDRILFSFPTPPQAVGETWACVSEEATEEWGRVVKHLWSLKPVILADDSTCPQFINFTQCGKTAWEAFTNGLAADLNDESLPNAVRGHLAKFKGYGARLSLIIHLLREACGEITANAIDGESVQRAGQLIAYFRSHALKVHAALGSDKRVADASQLWKWIRRQERATFTRRDAYRAMRGRVSRVDDLSPILELLTKHGYIRPVHEESQSGPKGGRPSEVYEMNPLDSGQNGQNGQNPAGG
jgi:hypothetical protein